MIQLDGVTVRYAESPTPVLDDVTLHIPEGDLALVAGQTGSGKSTLLGCLTNLVPRFTGGHRTGRVILDGADITTAAPRDLADLIGYVGQNPLAGFVTDTVESELAFGMEQLGVDPSRMRVRVEEVLDLLGITDLRRRALRTLSGGQQQRVAIASVLTARPRVLVLDEPTSALDPVAAEDVVSLLSRLVHDLGLTVVMAEHRMERVVEFCDRVVLVARGSVQSGEPREMLSVSPVAPPLVDLGRRSGWSPLPLTIRDGRRTARAERTAWRERPPVLREHTTPSGEGLVADGVIVSYGSLVAVRGATLTASAGHVTALVGRNGCGKSSLLWAVQGSGSRKAGRITVDGSPASSGDVALVPQTASDVLYLPTVAEELALADADAGCPSGAAGAILDELVDGVDPDQHPRDLSEGQKLALVLAVQLVRSPRVVLLDEPTRGLDYAGKAVLTRMLRAQADAGRTVVIATHDAEFVAATCDRVVVMAEGEIVDEGPARDIITSSAMLATQCARVYAPVELLTVAEVLTARAAS
ncbi:MAG TPA: ATP-binding cassette domain-containing protein [Propionibacteriaceae bacterium]|nr:ATP-binding cassette domain-containing protein [Propionibacteriaceae bacterium]